MSTAYLGLERRKRTGHDLNGRGNWHRVMHLIGGKGFRGGVGKLVRFWEVTFWKQMRLSRGDFEVRKLVDEYE